MNKVYKNYISGSVLQVSECLEIILFHKSSFKEKISLYNLKDFFLKNLTEPSEKFVRIYRESAEVPFIYKKELEGGFNVILYISEISSDPLGYTEFTNTQGYGISLGITVRIGRVYSGELILEIDNKLDGKDLWKDYRGKELYKYSTLDDLRERTYRNLFTSDIGRLESDRYSFIVSSSGVITKDAVWRLRVSSLSINSGYTNYNICFYNGVVVLAAWSGKSYNLYSLIGTLRPAVSGTTGYNIERIVGRYYFDTEKNLRDLQTGNIIEKKNRFMFVDYQDPRCKVYDLPTFYSSSTILKYIPEINNIFLDLDNYFRSFPVSIYSKIGSWYILLREYGGSNVYIAVSPTSAINMTEEDLSNAIFVGDQTMILKGDGYYTVYNSFGKELYTENARALLQNGRIGWWDGIFKFCFLDINEEDDKHFEEYYGDNGLAHIVQEGEELKDSVLQRYRKNIYPDYNRIPELIGSYGGLIFYKIGTKVDYL